MRAPLPRNWRDLHAEVPHDGDALVVPAHTSRSPYRAVGFIAPHTRRPWPCWTPLLVTLPFVALDLYLTEGFITLLVSGAGFIVSTLLMFLALLVEGLDGARRHRSLPLGCGAVALCALVVSVGAAGARHRSSARVIAAVDRYHGDHHRYPPSLDALAPTYLSRPPSASDLPGRAMRLRYEARGDDARLTVGSPVLSPGWSWDFRARRRVARR